MHEERLAGMGITLPEPPEPAGSYVPAVRTGSLLYVSGQIPASGGRVEFSGSVSDGNVAEAREAARLCALNLLAQARAALGSLDRVSRVVRISGFVNAGPGFSGHPGVINAASDLLFEVFGEAGRHSRIAVGVAGLPLGAMVEIDGIFECM